MLENVSILNECIDHNEIVKVYENCVYKGTLVNLVTDEYGIYYINTQNIDIVNELNTTKQVRFKFEVQEPGNIDCPRLKIPDNIGNIHESSERDISILNQQHEKEDIESHVNEPFSELIVNSDNGTIKGHIDENVQNNSQIIDENSDPTHVEITEENENQYTANSLVNNEIAVASKENIDHSSFLVPSQSHKCIISGTNNLKVFRRQPACDLSDISESDDEETIIVDRQAKTKYIISELDLNNTDNLKQVHTITTKQNPSENTIEFVERNNTFFDGCEAEIHSNLLESKNEQVAWVEKHHQDPFHDEKIPDISSNIQSDPFHEDNPFSDAETLPIGPNYPFKDEIKIPTHERGFSDDFGNTFSIEDTSTNEALSENRRSVDYNTTLLEPPFKARQAEEITLSTDLTKQDHEVVVGPKSTENLTYNQIETATAPDFVIKSENCIIESLIFEHDWERDTEHEVITKKVPFFAKTKIATSFISKFLKRSQTGESRVESTADKRFTEPRKEDITIDDIEFENKYETFSSDTEIEVSIKILDTCIPTRSDSFESNEDTISTDSDGLDIKNENRKELPNTTCHDNLLIDKEPHCYETAIPQVDEYTFSTKFSIHSAQNTPLKRTFVGSRGKTVEIVGSDYNSSSDDEEFMKSPPISQETKLVNNDTNILEERQSELTNNEFQEVKNSDLNSPSYCNQPQIELTKKESEQIANISSQQKEEGEAKNQLNANTFSCTSSDVNFEQIENTKKEVFKTTDNGESSNSQIITAVDEQSSECSFEDPGQNDDLHAQSAHGEIEKNLGEINTSTNEDIKQHFGSLSSISEATNQSLPIEIKESIISFPAPFQTTIEHKAYPGEVVRRKTFGNKTSRLNKKAKKTLKKLNFIYQLKKRIEPNAVKQQTETKPTIHVESLWERSPPPNGSQIEISCEPSAPFQYKVGSLDQKRQATDIKNEKDIEKVIQSDDDEIFYDFDSSSEYSYDNEKIQKEQIVSYDPDPKFSIHREDCHFTNLDTSGDNLTYSVQPLDQNKISLGPFKTYVDEGTSAESEITDTNASKSRNRYIQSRVL